MTPTPQEHVASAKEFVKCKSAQDLTVDDETIVISGLSGMYPQASNVKELSDILYNKINPVTSEHLRWDYEHPEMPKYSGMAPGLEYFDAQFFTVNYRLGIRMDPMSRKILEHTYQAIYDAGLSPAHLNEKKVAVYVGASFSETEKKGFIDNISNTGLGLVGCSRTMFANRISYWLNIKGTSQAVAETDCSSTIALEQAYLAIKCGECESAIVAGSYISLLPHATLHHTRIAAAPKDGKTKSFAQNSDGYILSDAIGVLFLQKAKDAKRVYAELLHVKNEFLSLLHDKTGPKYGFYRNPQTTAKFIKQFYKEAQATPQAVEYVEAYGTGVPDADKSELEALEEVYCDGRDDPLLVGSVTSNIGLTEGAAGMSSLTKVLLGYHRGEIAANLHCSSPRQDVAALREGRMRVVTEHQRFRRTYVAVNGMSVTGVNSHVLLHGRYKPKDLSRYASSIPRLVMISGRQESAINVILENIKSRPLDAEELALLHNIHENNISGHLGRGYAILDSNGNQSTVCLCEKVKYFDDARRPLWFVYSGMGSQWAGMGAQLMRIPIFAAAIERCHNVLKSKGLDIIQIITSPDKTVFDNILHSFVGIAAVQIGLTDILRELGLQPDGIIGHSVGELGCAYADGCLSAEEMIQCAYSRGKVSLETTLIRGSMAAVGLGYEQISKMCPPEIDVACHNGPDSSTISGPADVMREFVAQLTEKGVFAKEVPCSNIAYHSRYIADAGPSLLKYLKEVIENPKPRSDRWLSTSVPQKIWNEDLARYCSAEYHTNNLLNPVLFEETSLLIPSNAVLVEVAPHGLLQAILKRSLSSQCRHVPLTRRGHPDNALFLLQALGDLYMHSYTPRVQALYPKVEFPVSTETPLLSHLVEWSHSEQWDVMRFVTGKQQTAAACHFVKSIYDDEYSYLRGHVIRGKVCYPFAAGLVAVWDTLAMHSGVDRRQMSVQFRDVQLFAQPALHDQRPLRLSVALHRGNGRFEIMNQRYCKVASGFIVGSKRFDRPKIGKTSYDMVFSSKDVYQLLHDRDYDYSGEFRSIASASACLSEAALEWRGNWVTLIDGMLQLNMLRQTHSAVSLPTHIRKICIDVIDHYNHTYHLSGKTVVNANVLDIHDFTRCGGVSLHNIKYRHLPPVTQDLTKIDLKIPYLYGYNANEANISKGKMNIAVTLECSEIGNLDSLRWVEAPLLEQSDVTVTVHYAGLNVSDMTRASGVTSCGSNMYGMDYSGTTKSGERVMGLVCGGAASSVVRARPELLWPVPAHWSLEDAATVPLAYAHAFYCLIIKCNLQRGMSVLVHGGAGALGQASIALALACGCQVFTTVSDTRKKHFLLKIFPELKADHVGNSRDHSFKDMILNATKQSGCDIVISSVRGCLKTTTISCVGRLGTYLDVSESQNQDEYFELGMYSLSKERAFSTVNFSTIFKHENTKDLKVLHRLLSEGISGGYVRPLSRVTYAPQDAARALRLLAASNHRGRVLLHMQHSVSDAYPRITCDPDQCHILFCDDGALGVQLADRLVYRGARKLYINCTNLTQYQLYKIEQWRKHGVDVRLASEDVNNNEIITTLLIDASRLGSINGIYVAITNVPNYKHQEYLNFLNTLDTTSRSLVPKLQYFAVVSTVSAVGQDTCVARAKCGFVATSLDLSCFTDSPSKASPHDVVDATERALCTTSPVLVAQPARAAAPEILQQIIARTGIKSLQNKSSDATLQELGMAHERVPLLCAYLNMAYNISLNEDTVLQFTLQKLHELVKTSTDIVPRNESGLATFFSNVSSDELLATDDIVALPTLDRDTLKTDVFAVSKRYLGIVPGMEGHHERFRVLCERLKMPALVLQPGLDHPRETVIDTAHRYAQILMKKTKVYNNFYLLGYETGVLVALELAAILEDSGLIGTVFCVGYAPNELQAVLTDHISNFKNDEQLQDAVVRHMFTLMAGNELRDLERALQPAGTWSEKVDACVQTLQGRVTHSTQYARGLIEAAKARIERARGYVPPVRTLRSRLVLLRAATEQAPDTHALQRHSQQPVAVHQLRTPLSYVAKDMECTAIINRYLDDEIQREFEKQNLCDVYGVNY